MKGSPTKVVDAEGREYPSMLAAAKALGCAPNAVRYAMQKGRVPCKKEREHAWGTTSRLARERGLEPMTVHNRMKRRALLEMPLRDRRVA
jgi:hypothetical protein